VIRACREAGITSIAVYSDADARARHVTLADRAVHIGPAPAVQSYLSIDKILGAARAASAEAVHPGYGFLSENQEFAAACAAAGLTFIGPPPEALATMGSKIAARALVETAGVPVVPGEVPRAQDDQTIAAAAMRIGLPVLIKPSEGGGGIGMKTVRERAALLPAIAQARREAAAAFGDGTLYVERFVENPRHVEFQVMADRHGRVVHLFERECSLQRRHQKIVEESPSVALTPALRARMGAAAVRIARAADYVNAGTVEFLLDGETFYFLEMNTRLQVEHPVTEQVTGIDLVRAQLAVAAGDALPWTQEQLTQRGHAIEVRVYAEDPHQGDLPQAGPLLLYREPDAPGVRIDSGVTEGGEIPVHYDPLIAKLITTGETREAARARAVAALRDFPILGIRTNVAFLIALLEHPRFVSGDVDTHFVEHEREMLVAQTTHEPSAEVLAIAEMATLPTWGPPGGPSDSPVTPDPWTTLQGFRV
jgi:acetyl/propionyl-CoA carboxylase alpha subunit